MLITVWSVKGGVGATTVAVAASSVTARTTLSPVLVVDLGGDVPACLGIPEPSGPGLSDWLAAGSEVPPDSLGRLTTPIAPGLELLARGSGPLDPARAGVLVQLLAASGRPVVVDAGNVTWSPVAQRCAAEADRSLLVTRACVLGVRRALSAPVRPSGVIVVRDPGRALSSRDLTAAIGAPIVAELAVDPSVARAVDGGLAHRRLPRSYADAIATLLPAEAHR